MRRFQIFRSYVVALSLTLAASTSVSAQEAICPGGSNPRADVLLCRDFDKVSRCTTGRETDCWADNGFNASAMRDAFGFSIGKTGAAAGNGMLYGSGEYGSTGPGYTEFPFSRGYDAMTMRYYVKFDKSYMMYGAGSHGPGIRGGGTNCTMGGTFEQPLFGYFYYNAGTCGAGSMDLKANKSAAPILRNNRWYLIEQQRITDTQCSNINDTHGCNGVARLWIDGVLVMEYTDINWGGVKNGLKWGGVNGPRHYFHVRVPEWKPNIFFDNLVVAGSAQTIGAAANENARGTADMNSPYLTYMSIEPFAGHHPADDCSSTPSAMSSNLSQWWRSRAVYDSSVVYNGMVDKCPGPSSNASMKVALSGGKSDGGGIAWGRAGGGGAGALHTFEQQVLSGWIYLPSSNDYSTFPALSGFRGYSCGIDRCDTAQWGNYLALTVNNGKWALVERVNKEVVSPQVVLTSTEAVQFDRWQEFEMVIWRDQRVSLSINRKRLFEKTGVPLRVDWMFELPVDSSLVAGIIDYTGAKPFTAYFDDMKSGTASFWNCDGWSSSACPFSGQSTPGTPPASPPPLPVAPQGVTAAPL